MKFLIRAIQILFVWGILSLLDQAVPLNNQLGIVTLVIFILGPVSWAFGKMTAGSEVMTHFSAFSLEVMRLVPEEHRGELSRQWRITLQELRKQGLIRDWSNHKDKTEERTPLRDPINRIAFEQGENPISHWVPQGLTAACGRKISVMSVHYSKKTEPTCPKCKALRSLSATKNGSS